MNCRKSESYDPSFLLEHIRQNTMFDAVLLEKIISEWKLYKSTGLQPEEITGCLNKLRASND